MKILKNQKGVSLVGVLIASGLLGGLFLLVGKLMQNSNMVLKTTEVGLEVLDYEALLEDTLRDRASCTRTFGKVLSTDPTPVIIREGFAPSSNNTLDTSGIFNADGTEIWKKDNLVVGGLKLKSLTIPEKRFDPNTKTQIQNYTTINSALNKGFVEVHLELEKTGKSTKTFGGQTKHIKIYLTAEVYDDANEDYRISSCQLSGAPMQSPGVELAEELACTTNNKFYDATKTPKCQESKGSFHNLPVRRARFYPGHYTEKNLRCPQGTVITGLKGKGLKDLNGAPNPYNRIITLAVLCRPIDVETLKAQGQEFTVKGSNYFFHGIYGIEKTVRCPGNTIATGYKWNGSISLTGGPGGQCPGCHYLKGLALTCGSSRSSPYLGNSSTPSSNSKYRAKRYEDKCPLDTFLREVLTMSYSEVQQISGNCW